MRIRSSVFGFIRCVVWSFPRSFYSAGLFDPIDQLIFPWSNRDFSVRPTDLYQEFQMSPEVRHICLLLNYELSFRFKAFLLPLSIFAHIQISNEPSPDQIFVIISSIFPHTSLSVDRAHLIIYLPAVLALSVFVPRGFSLDLSGSPKLSF